MYLNDIESNSNLNMSKLTDLNASRLTDLNASRLTDAVLNSEDNFSKNGNDVPDDQPDEGEVTDQMIDNYFKALQRVTQNRLTIQIDQITERSTESDITMALRQMPSFASPKCNLENLSSKYMSNSNVSIRERQEMEQLTITL